MSAFTLLLLLAALALGLAGVLIWRARKPPVPPVEPVDCDDGGSSDWARQWVLAAVHLLRFLSGGSGQAATLPWILLLGPRGGGKTSIAGSLRSGTRAHQLLGQRPPAIKGTDWRFFDQGAVIDAPGALSGAALQSADGQRWRRMLAALRDRRPSRPLDGVVLVIPADMLVAAGAALDAAAQLCFRQLWQLQKECDFSLPVYVLVSRCDELDGFSAFWRALPAAAEGRICGWSNPALRGGRPLEWTDATYAQLDHALTQLQLDLAAHSQTTTEADAIFLFPHRLAATRSGLLRLLDTVFQPSTWQAGHLCRGIYFCGSVDARGELLDGAREDVRLIDGLFEQRIFKERNLGLPTRHGLWSPYPMIRRLQQAAVGGLAALFVLLAVSVVWLREDARQMSDALHALRDAQQRLAAEARSSAAPGGGLPVCTEGGPVFAFVAAAARLQLPPTAWWIPASWFDHRAEHSLREGSVSAALRDLVLPAVRCGLQQREQALLTSVAEPAAASASNGADTPIQQQMDALIAVTMRVVVFEEQLASYERLTTSTDGASPALLNGLLEYVFGQKPADSRGEHNGLRPALAAAAMQAGPWSAPPPVDRRAQALATHTSTSTAGLLDTLKAQIDRGAADVVQLEQGREDAEFMQQLLRVDAWWRWLRSDWAGARPGGNPCARLLAKLRGAQAPLPQPAYERLEAAEAVLSDRVCFDALRSRLLQMRIPLDAGRYGPPMTTDGDRLEPSAAPVLEGLSRVAALQYLRRPAPISPPPACRDTTGWDAARLRQALDALSEYTRFVGESSTGAEAATGLQPAALARRGLRVALQGTLQAARLGGSAAGDAMPEPAVAQHSAQLLAVTPLLVELLQALRQLPETSAVATQLAQCVGEQTNAALSRVDALVAAARLYVTEVHLASGHSEAGDGGDTRLYALPGADTLRVELAAQLARVQVLASYAAPYVMLFENAGIVGNAAPELLARATLWQATGQEVQRALQFKDPQSQPAQIDSLYLNLLLPIDAVNCAQLLADYRSPALRQDLFSRQRGALERQTRALCDNGADAMAQLRFAALATRFNSELRGRYPFAPPGAADLSPATLRAFLLDYDRERADLRKQLAAARVPLNVTAFLRDLDGVAAFFRPTLSAPAGTQPLQIEVAFNQVRRNSLGADQIVDWQLRAGSAAARYPNGPAGFQAEFVDSAQVQLLWADRSTLRPRADAAQPALKVEGASALFAASGPWALLRLIESQRPRYSPAVDPLDPSRVMLEFNVPVGPVDARAPGSGTARVYLSLSLTGKDPVNQSRVTLRLPGFPSQAPTGWTNVARNP